MSVLAKLMDARVILQTYKLEKTGYNKFSQYFYFQLSDFLPTVQQIFKKLNLCGFVTYTSEMATLTITDIDDGTSIQITSPMAEANLKGAHPIQNLGAVETYIRRYLWVTAMEIVEHDSLDDTMNKNVSKSFKSTPIGEDPFALVPADEHEYIRELADKIRSVSAEEANSMIAAENLEAEQKVALWSLLDSKTRSAIKKVKSNEQI